MTVSYQDVWECFGTTVNRDFFHMVVGDIIGAGEFRIVFEHAHRKDLVLKFEPSAQSFHNVSEWGFWEKHGDDKKVGPWLAPCEFISPCGIILAQKKTTKPERLRYPKTVPAFLTDLKRRNFGMYKGKLVAHDYGLHRVTVSLKREKADWWGDYPMPTS